MCTCMLYELFFIDNVMCRLSCINTCACHVYFTINLLTHLLAYYYWHHPFNGPLSRTTWVSRYKKGKTSLNLKEARDDGVLGCSGISWTICKTICTSLQTDNHTNTSSLSFYRSDALPDAQPTASKQLSIL